jgi:hypothetical protein
MIPSHLLPRNFERSAIMMATHANLLLLPVRDGPASTVATLANFSLQLIVVIFCKISFHFCEDRRIFCEGEYQVKNNGYAIDKQYQVKDDGYAIDKHHLPLSVFGLISAFSHNSAFGHNLAFGLIMAFGIISIGGFGSPSLVSFIGLDGLIDFGFIGCNGPVGCIGLISIVGLFNLGGISLIGPVGIIGLIGLIGFGFVGHTGLFSLISLVGLGLISLVGLGLISLVGHIDLIGIVGLVNLGSTSLISLVGLIGFIGLIGLDSLVGFGLNGLNGISLIGISLSIIHIQFEIETKFSPCYLFVKEGWLWCVRRVLSSLTGLDSDFFFGLALQNGKQIFFNRIPQMIKYFVMRECEDIPTWNIYTVTQHLLTKRNFLFLNSLKGF